MMITENADRKDNPLRLPSCRINIVHMHGSCAWGAPNYLYIACRCHSELGRGCLCSIWKDLLHGLIHRHPN